MPVSKVERISYEESTVFVNLTKEAVEQSPAHHLAPVRRSRLDVRHVHSCFMKQNKYPQTQKSAGASQPMSDAETNKKRN